MSVRIAVGLSVVAVLVALAAMALAVVALTEDAPASSAPTRDEPGAYTKSGVEEAIRRYERDGLDAAVGYYNSAESVDGEWYVFIVNSEGYTIAHHNPKFMNRDPSLRVDSKGRFYGDELLGATARRPVGRLFP